MTNQKEEYSYDQQIIDDAILQVSHGEEAYCFTRAQSNAITDKLNKKEVQYTIANDDGIYTIKAKNGKKDYFMRKHELAMA